MLELKDIRAKKSGVFAYVLACLCLTSVVNAEPIKVTVLDADGDPVGGVVVYSEPSAPATLSPPTAHAVMDQIDGQFEPHVLIVQTGTEVRFPNSDVVAHHVYSFSNPNDFILPLYRGNAHAPVTFSESGVVTLGCNIHDQMLGYILIVDSNVFAKTDANGVAILSVDDSSSGAVRIWSPRITSKGETLYQAMPENRPGDVVFNLSGKLRPAHASQSGALQWSDY